MLALASLNQQVCLVNVWNIVKWAPPFSSSRISGASLSKASQNTPIKKISCPIKASERRTSLPFTAKPTAASDPPPPRTPNEPNLEPATWFNWFACMKFVPKVWSPFVSGKIQVWETNQRLKCFKNKNINQLIQSILHPELRMGFLQGQLCLQKKTSWWLDSQHQKPYSLLCGDSK